MYIGKKIVIFGSRSINHHTPIFILLFGRGESINRRSKLIYVSIIYFKKKLFSDQIKRMSYFVGGAT
jgi:hypothetical protein